MLFDSLSWKLALGALLLFVRVWVEVCFAISLRLLAVSWTLVVKLVSGFLFPTLVVIEGWLRRLTVPVNSLFLVLLSARLSPRAAAVPEQVVLSVNMFCPLLMWLTVSRVDFLLFVRATWLLTDMIVVLFSIGPFSLICVVVTCVTLTLIGRAGRVKLCILGWGLVRLRWGRCGSRTLVVDSLRTLTWWVNSVEWPYRTVLPCRAT